jgi:hypothetical protein
VSRPSLTVDWRGDISLSPSAHCFTGEREYFRISDSSRGADSKSAANNIAVGTVQTLSLTLREVLGSPVDIPRLYHRSLPPGYSGAIPTATCFCKCCRTIIHLTHFQRCTSPTKPSLAISEPSIKTSVPLADQTSPASHIPYRVRGNCGGGSIREE